MKSTSSLVITALLVLAGPGLRSLAAAPAQGTTTNQIQDKTKVQAELNGEVQELLQTAGKWVSQAVNTLSQTMSKVDGPKEGRYMIWCQVGKDKDGKPIYGGWGSQGSYDLHKVELMKIFGLTSLKEPLYYDKVEKDDSGYGYYLSDASIFVNKFNNGAFPISGNSSGSPTGGISLPGFGTGNDDDPDE